jgi:hypothetical protein
MARVKPEMGLGGRRSLRHRVSRIELDGVKTGHRHYLKLKIPSGLLLFSLSFPCLFSCPFREDARFARVGL